MNEFERRWKLGAAAAATTRPTQDEAAPFGFATRIVAQCQAAPAPAWSTLWQRQALRLCAALTLVVVLASFSLKASFFQDGETLQPTIENTVDDLFWAL